jgi:hypothetical protein
VVQARQCLCCITPLPNNNNNNRLWSTNQVTEALGQPMKLFVDNAEKGLALRTEHNLEISQHVKDLIFSHTYEAVKVSSSYVVRLPAALRSPYIANFIVIVYCFEKYVFNAASDYIIKKPACIWKLG